MKQVTWLKLSAIAGAAASLVCMSSAYADVNVTSNVTIYGSLDAGPTYVSNAGGGAKTILDYGGLQPDRIGFRGIENLGDGYSAVFKLENGFSTATGAMIRPGVLFNRMSYVGIANQQVGTLTLGHQTTIMFDMLDPLSTGYLLGSFYAFHPGNLDDVANIGTPDNVIKFTSANFNGLTAAAMIGLGGQAGDSSTNRVLGFGANYVNGPLKIGAAYNSANNKVLTLQSTMGLTSLAGQDFAATGGTMPTNNVRNMGIGASYNIDPVLLHTLFTQTRIEGLVGSAKMNNAELGANFRITPAYSFNVGYTYSKLEDMKWNQFNLNNVYSLSKRTEVYLQGTLQKASGQTDAGTSTLAAINTAGISSNQSQATLRLGVHHSF